MSTIINKTDSNGYLQDDLMAVNGTTIDTNSGTKSAGTIRIVIATDQPQLTNALKVDGSAVTQPVSGTITANAGTGTFNIQSNASINLAQIGGNSAVTAGVNGTLAVGGNQATNTAISTNTYPLLIGGSDYGGTPKIQSLKVDSSGNCQVAITNTPTVTANAGTGTFNVQGPVASGASNGNNPVKVGGVYNSTQPTVTTGQIVDLQATSRGAIIVATGTDALNATQSGTWTVQPGNTANTTPWLTTNVPASGGATGWQSKQMGDGTVGSNWNGAKQQVVGSAATFGGYVMLYNPNTAVSYIQVFNKTSANVTLGTTTPDYVIPLPGVASASASGAAANNEIVNGVKFNTGLTMAVTTTATGSTAPSSNVYGWILYN